MPKVTVLMSVYNGEHYLAESIETILNQTFQDFEFLIINDGSTDRTRQIILSLDDPRIRLVNNEQNLGLTRSLNKGLRLAKGEFVARQDADDLSEPERLQSQVDFLEKHPEIALLGTWHQEVDANGNPTGAWDLPSSWTEIRWAMFFYTPFVHSSIMMRKSILLDKVGFYNESLSYSQDFELWTRVAKNLPVFSLKQRLVKTRVNSFSMTATYGDKILEGFQIRSSTIAHLLGFNETEMALKDAYLNQITAFLFNFSYSADISFEKLSAGEISDAVERIVELQKVFCKIYSLNEIDCKKHCAKIYNHINSRLLELAQHYAERNVYLMWFFFAKAFRLPPSISLAKSYLKTAFKLLLNLRFVEMLSKNR